MKTTTPCAGTPRHRYSPVRRLLVLAIFLGFTGAAFAGTVFQNPDYQYVVDIPVGWEVLDAQRADFVSFTDPARKAVFQIIAFPGEQFVTARDLDAFIRERFGAAGNQSDFRYLGDHAVFADYTFSTGEDAGEGSPITVRGYMVFINGDEFDFALMTYAVLDHYEWYHDILLSALDSFSPDARHRMQPGPVSTFYAAPVKEQLRESGVDGRSAAAGASVLPLPSGEEHLLAPRIASEGLREAAQVLIEREARVLADYAPPEGASARFGDGPVPEWARAWRRYFRMVYRDNYDRLESVAEALFDDLASQGVPREEMPARILAWLQEAQYQRTSSLSDLMSPAWCLVEFAGDCDSLGLTYAILLHHLGFEAILMVSIEYAHALVGVDVPGEGARFPFEGRQWLVAELTVQVPIGQIAEDMSDIGGWVGIKLDPTIPW
ncbi:MAG: hypothetical protein EA427_17555 [Spirochaetaceae bacterium]|nr:MAG: hypothetical protein EA427_17555 [Spirochaetaceae bacterium]